MYQIELGHIQGQAVTRKQKNACARPHINIRLLLAALYVQAK